QAQALSCTGREVLEEDVRGVDELVHDAGRLRRLEVEREALLRPVDPHEVARHPLDGRVVAAGEVANPGSFDLDDPGPQVGELAGGERGRDGLLAADDGDALERAGAGHAMPPIPCGTGAVVVGAGQGPCPAGWFHRTLPSLTAE